MGEWQRNQLKGATDLLVVVAMHADKDAKPPTPAAGDRWQRELRFKADRMLMDYGRAVTNRYQRANPGAGRMTQAVTVFIDRRMKIRHVFSTYDVDHRRNLKLLQQILAER